MGATGKSWAPGTSRATAAVEPAEASAGEETAAAGSVAAVRVASVERAAVWARPAEIGAHLGAWWACAASAVHAAPWEPFGSLARCPNPRASHPLGSAPEPASPAALCCLGGRFACRVGNPAGAAAVPPGRCLVCPASPASMLSHPSSPLSQGQCCGIGAARVQGGPPASAVGHCETVKGGGREGLAKRGDRQEAKRRAVRRER